jgi:hypothetical protein
MSPAAAMSPAARAAQAASAEPCAVSRSCRPTERAQQASTAKARNAGAKAAHSPEWDRPYTAAKAAAPTTPAPA